MNISCNEISSKLKKSETMGFQWVESDPTLCFVFPLFQIVVIVAT